MLGPIRISRSTNLVVCFISDCQLLLCHSTDINSPLYPWLECNEHHRIKILEFSELLNAHINQNYSDRIATIKALIINNIKLLALTGERKHIQEFLQTHPPILKFYLNNLGSIQSVAKDYEIYNMSLQFDLNLSFTNPIYNDCLNFCHELQQSMTEEQALRRIENGSIPPNLDQNLLFMICQKKEFHRLSNELEQRHQNQQEDQRLAKKVLRKLYLKPKPK
jgi:hypothetical protein